MLLVSHEASRTGAPRVGIEVIRAFRSAGFETVVVHRWGGPLESELNGAADQHGFEPLLRIRAWLRNHGRTRRFAVGLETFAARLVLLRHRPSLVWCNTSLSACYVKPAQRAQIPVVLHVHEMGDRCAPILRRYGLDSGSNALGRVTLVACSSAAANDLARTTEVDRAAIRVLPSSVDVDAIRAAAAGIGPNEDVITVIACGTANRMKGLDTFVEVAQAITRESTARFRFEWIGKHAPSDELIDNSFVTFSGELDNPALRLATANIILVPTKADAFPLVVLEAMALSKPIIAFGVGGIPEQLGDSGIVVSPGDTESMVVALRLLASDEARQKFLGDAAQQRVRALWDISVFRSNVDRIALCAMQSPRSVPSVDRFD